MGVTWLNLNKFVVGDRDQYVMMISMTLHLERQKELRQTVRRLNNNPIFDFFLFISTNQGNRLPFLDKASSFACFHVVLEFCNIFLRSYEESDV
jgi:hypothetical protein